MNIIKIEDNKNNVIKKHNDLIQKARYSLSEQGIKLVSMLIGMIRVDDVDFQEYNIQVKDFAKMINSTSGEIYKQVDNLTDELMKQPFKIGDEKFNWCYYSRYKENEAYLTLKIAPELKPYLLELKSNFTEYNLQDILMLKSRYVIRLYEYCIAEWRQYKAYNAKSKSFTFEIEIAELRELFEIPESQLYADIKRNIIDKAVKQFKDKTNIKIDYKEQKLGRAVVRLQITVSENQKGSNDFLKDLKIFKAYIRKNYENKDLFEQIDQKTGKHTIISVDKNGFLYDKKTALNFEKKNAEEIWEWLYDTASKDKLYSLKQGKLDI